MFLSIYSLLYLCSLGFTIVVTFTTSNWLMCWMMMEINLMMFIPLLTEKEYLMECPQSIKYFLVQVLGSMVLVLFLCLENTTYNMNMLSSSSTLLLTSLAIKSGIPPFHFWFPQIVEYCNMMQCFLILAVQKIIPMALIQFCYSSSLSILMIVSALVGAYGGINQNSIKKMLAYSSMVHSSWMILSIKSSNLMFIIYLAIYTFISLCVTFIIYKMNFYKISEFVSANSNKMGLTSFSLNMMSLGGLPPLLGFLAKAMAISESSEMLTVITILVISSLLSLTYYTRIIWLAMSSAFYSKKEKMSPVSQKENSFYYLNIVMNILLISIVLSVL
uniref:NADH-ubiquinone oxidoreductase chain 2 n=1 Tax=Sminthurides bifidus TaxID=2584528 RepID=A0A6H0EWY2_9HEXA|nr:NADH dehydrogenase subunit 2 [Sminthurides bifidus]